MTVRSDEPEEAASEHCARPPSAEYVAEILGILERWPPPRTRGKSIASAANALCRKGYEITKEELHAVLRHPAAGPRVAECNEHRYILKAHVGRLKLSKSEAKTKNAAESLRRRFGSPNHCSDRYTAVLTRRTAHGHAYAEVRGEPLFIPQGEVRSARLSEVPLGSKLTLAIGFDDQERPVAKRVCVTALYAPTDPPFEGGGRLGYVPGKNRGHDHRAAHVVPHQEKQSNRKR